MAKKDKPKRKIYPVDIRSAVGDILVTGERVGTIPYKAITDSGGLNNDFVKGNLPSDSKEHVVVVVSGEHGIYVALEEDVTPIEV